MTAAAVRSWVVNYHPAGGGPAQPWLLLRDVPREVTRAGVLEALEGWAEWQRRFARAVAPGSRTTLRLVGRGTDVPASSVPWDRVQPEARAITVKLPGAIHGALTRLARAEGKTIEQLAAEALTALLAAVPGQEDGE